MHTQETMKNIPRGNILIVDDEKIIRKLLSKYLKDAGYTCWTAPSVKKAKELLQSMSFDLLITDINMPDQSGIALARYVKDTSPTLPIIIASVIDNPLAAKEVLELDIYGYIVKPFTRNLVLINVENAVIRHRLELQAREYQEGLEKRVLEQSRKMKASEEKYRQIVDNIGIGVALLSPQLEILQLNPQIHKWFTGIKPNKGQLCHQTFFSPAKETPCDNCPVAKALATGESFDFTITIEDQKGDRYFRESAFPIHDEKGNITAAILLLEEVTEKLTMEQELRQSQKLESIGQLASGIAHEINSPIQYVGDNLGFLKDSFCDIVSAFATYDELLKAVKTKTVTDAIVGGVEERIEEADIAYLNEEIPRAVEQSLEGVKRVSEIVRAMRDFSHPGTDQKEMVNLNRAIKNTITVARNEWKYVAEMELDLDNTIPEVLCLPGEINQVLLNVIVNAAHAIGDTVDGGNLGKGKITISTCKNKSSVTIHISDTGGGIPKAIQHRIFDPFFTTKDVGKGTGQGLAIAHSVIADKHQGTLSFETQQKKGTTFFIELPLIKEKGELFYEG